ncbi:energy transducer TonB [Salinimicrobium sp. CAU 1759]
MLKNYICFLFLILFTSEAFPQQEEESAAFVPLIQAEEPPYNSGCSERSAACTAAIIEKYLLQHIPGVGPLAAAGIEKIEMPVRVIIDTSGKVSWTSVKGIPEEAAKLLSDRLRDMPPFFPGEHEGKKANIIVDLKMPLYLSNSQKSFSEVILSENAEQKPVWKTCRKTKERDICSTTSINDWMNRNVRTSARKEPGSYSLTAAFVVGVDGKVGQIVVYGGGDQFAGEVIKQLQKMPAFEPGAEDGEPVAVSFLLPMSFSRF